MIVVFAGWSHSRDGQSDSSNSGSNLYPVMMHPNASAYSSNPVFPGFPSMSGPSATATSQHHGLSQPLPGTSGANPYANLMPGTSGSVDPAGGCLPFFSHFNLQVTESQGYFKTTICNGEQCI